MLDPNASDAILNGFLYSPMYITFYFLSLLIKDSVQMLADRTRRNLLHRNTGRVLCELLFWQTESGKIIL